MRDSKFVPYLEKLRQGTLTRQEGDYLYNMVRKFIQALDARYFKVKYPPYKPGILPDRILAFYEYMTSVATHKPVVYAFQSFRRKYAQVLAVLSLRSIGVAVPMKSVDTADIRYVVMHQTIKRRLGKEPHFSDVLQWVTEGKGAVFYPKYPEHLLRTRYNWYNALPWRQVLDQQIN